MCEGTGPAGAPEAFFLLNGGKIWVRREGGRVSPLFRSLPAAPACWEPVFGSPYGAAESALPPAPDAECMPLRPLFGMVPDALFALAGRARQLVGWRAANRFCGGCGGALERHESERAMRCPACGRLFYPRINPAVIVLVTNGGRVLLTRKANNLYPFWSLVAGFVEAGESLEETVGRELREETGLRVRDVRYAMSQPWPFPNNLMIGFTAEYAGGDLRPDGGELDAAGWFGPDELPAIPGPVSIARRLIEKWRNGTNGTKETKETKEKAE